MELPKILLAHPGTQHSHQLAKQLFHRKLLYKFVTGFALSEKSILHSLIKGLPQKISKPFSNRIIAKLDSNKIKSFPFTDIALKKSASKEIALFKRNEIFQRKVPSTLIKRSNIVIGFDTSSLLLAQKTKALGRKFILDVSIAHSASKNKVYKNIVEQFPDWGFALEEKSVEFLAIEQQEYAIADAIVVAGSFTKKTLMDNAVPEEKIFINPYGIDIKKFVPKQSYNKCKPVKFLFVGFVDARKGIPLLMSTIKSIQPDEAHFTLVGPVDEKIMQLINAYSFSHVKLVGKIPHQNISKVFAEHDVFVFPSYFEGFGLVILEAMASGLPVIITEATAGEDCVENGKEGFIVESGNESALEKSIRYFIQQPEQIENMGIAARKKAEQFTWDAYGDRWENIINEVLAEQSKLS